MEGLAYLQLGRLYLDAKDHASATQAFAMAVDANGQSADALYGLAQAAALDGDLATSYWAARELDRLQWHDPHLYRLKAIQAALAQQAQAARAWGADYARSTGEHADATYLRTRVDQLLAMQPARFDGASPAGGAGAPVVATPAVAPGAAKSDVKPAAPAAAGDAAQVPKWFRCDTAPAIPSRAVVNAGAGASDENITLPPLPAPCPGETPRTALIEVTIIQTEETKGKNLGINLLNGLTGIFTLQRARTTTAGSTNASTTTNTNNFVLSNGVDNAIDVLRYSLNIANAAYTRDEVLARPTLAAIDRVPAVFFSGATINLGIAGVGGGTSTIVYKTVGVSLTEAGNANMGRRRIGSSAQASHGSACLGSAATAGSMIDSEPPPPWRRASTSSPPMAATRSLTALWLNAAARSSWSFAGPAPSSLTTMISRCGCRFSDSRTVVAPA